MSDRLTTFWVVRTPTGDRPYTSTSKPESYIKHLDASGDKAEVFEVEVNLPDDLMPGDSIVGKEFGDFVVKVTRER